MMSLNDTAYKFYKWPSYLPQQWGIMIAVGIKSFPTNETFLDTSL